MTLTSSLQSSRMRMSQFWVARAPRERVSLKLMAAVLSLVLLWAVYAALQAERARLDRALPLARSQVAAMQDAAAELARLRAQPKSAPSDLNTAATALNASAKAVELPLSIASDGQRLSVTGDGVAFDQWLNWAALAHRTHRVYLVELTASKDATGARVEAYLTVAP